MVGLSTPSIVGSIIVIVQSNRARALHIKTKPVLKPVSFDQKSGRRLHQTTLWKPAEVSLLSLILPRRERPLLAGNHRHRGIVKFLMSICDSSHWIFTF